MFQYYNECAQEFQSSSSALATFLQTLSAIIATGALFVAWRSLKGVKRSQSLQAQMNLISLENEIRKNHSQLKSLNAKYASDSADKNTSQQALSLLFVEKTNAFELYVSSADKLAVLINSKFLVEQFRDRNWKEEYLETFKKVKSYYQDDEPNASEYSYMITNIEKTLIQWAS